MPREIHIAPCPTSAGLINRALRLKRGACVANLDTLSGGPIPHSLSFAELLQVRDYSVSLTDAGIAALAGNANFVELNGIDDWIGGVHLDSNTGNVWFRDGDRLLRA